MSDFAQSRQRDFPSATVYLWTPFHRWSSQSLLEGWLGVLPIDREKPAWLAISSARLLFQEGFLAVTCQPDHMQVRLKATSMESISK